MNSEVGVFTNEDIEKNKTMAGLTYIVFIIGLIMMKDSKFIKFHVNQIIVLYIPMFILCMIHVAGGIALATSLKIKLALALNAGCSIIYLGFTILAIINMIAAFKGEAKRIPIIGKWTIIPGSNDMEDAKENETTNSFANKISGMNNIDMKQIKNSAAISKITNSIENINIPNIGVTVVCEECGASVMKGKKFCGKCGASMPVSIEKVEKTSVEYICTKCAHEFHMKAKFCTECGGTVVPKPELGPPTCVNCGEVVEDGIKFCPECGGKIAQEEIIIPMCKKCSYEFKENEKFCPECGVAKEDN